MRLIAIVLALCIAAVIAPAHAAPQAASADAAPQVLYRCNVGGQVTYTTIPQRGCVVIFTYTKAAPARSVERNTATTGSGFYTNSQGEAVHRPMRANQAPPGASAQCRDGTYSFSTHRRGTCSHHGGVARWL
jgi:hypothetical protein